jgi:RNA polymerase sigma-70 factor (ECF subfamily)
VTSINQETQKPKIMLVNALYHQAPDKLRMEQEWIQQAKEDPQKFSRLYLKYHDQINRYIASKVICAEQASDITAQVFFKAFSNLHKYKFQGLPFGSWLYRIAKSEIYQTFRDSSKMPSVDFDKVNFSLFFESYEEEDNAENIEKLKHCLNSLKEDEYNLIHLRYYQALSYKEIGEMLDISENNAKVKAFRAISKLKKFYFS